MYKFDNTIKLELLDHDRGQTGHQFRFKAIVLYRSEPGSLTFLGLQVYAITDTLYSVQENAYSDNSAYDHHLYMDDGRNSKWPYVEVQLCLYAVLYAVFCCAVVSF